MKRYQAFITIVKTGSFTKASEELGYTQSAISQMILSLERELSTTLLLRSRTGISLTPDGEELLPYIERLTHCHLDLVEKKREMTGLQNGLVRIGTFSSISCSWLPELIKEFKEMYPLVIFELHQGEYTSIAQLVKEGSVDFGFVNPAAISNLNTIPLIQDEMLAILPNNHPLVSLEKVSLNALSTEPFILLDEGHLSGTLEFFKLNHLEPNIQYRVHDDYTIMSMIEKGLGISVLPKLILSRVNYNIVTKEISPPIIRTIAIAFKNKKALPLASKYFLDFIVKHFNSNSKEA